jgi:hypothetical protein
MKGLLLELQDLHLQEEKTESRSGAGPFPTRKISAGEIH